MGKPWSALAALALVACGGATADGSGDAGVRDGQTDASSADGAGDDGATDAAADAAYLACMSTTGQLDGSLKSCHSNSDCIIKEEQTDCCGTTLYVGVRTASAAKFDACEAAWIGHFPPCGCASNQTATEDGKMSRRGMDGGTPQVHCIDFTMNGGVCMTYVP